MLVVILSFIRGLLGSLSLSLSGGALVMQTLNGFSPTCAFTGKESLTALAVEASKKALQMAEVDPDDIDLVLMCTSTPEDLFGGAPQV